MIVKFVTPTGALGQIEIDPPKDKLNEWQERSYIKRELDKRFIEAKKYWKA